MKPSLPFPSAILVLLAALVAGGYAVRQYFPDARSGGNRSVAAVAEAAQGLTPEPTAGASEQPSTAAPATAMVEKPGSGGAESPGRSAATPGAQGGIVANGNSAAIRTDDARRLMQEAIARMDLSTGEKRAASVARIRAAEEALRLAGEARARELGLPVKSADGSAWITGLTPDGLPAWTSIENVNAAVSTNLTAARAREEYADLTGAGMLLGEWDSKRARETHVEFEGRLILKDPAVTGLDTHYHATHVAGTLIGGGLTPALRGMAPGATLWYWNGPNDISEMTGVAAVTATEGMDAAHLLMSNHSYGLATGWHYIEDNKRWQYYGPLNSTEDPNLGRYGPVSQAVDQLCRQAPSFLPFYSAGNQRTQGPAPGDSILLVAANISKFYDPAIDPPGDWQNGGFDTVGSDKAFKNAMAVGAVKDAVSGGSRSLPGATQAPFSSWGPVDDGRVKPDIVANGVDLLSAWDTSDTASSTIAGTSMASPNACGSALILQQYFKQRYDTVMLSSQLKALIIHTADDLGNTGPDYTSGWGLMNTEAALDTIRDAADHPGTPVLKTTFLANGWKDEWTTVVNYAGGAPLKITLCWTDPAATPVANNNLNDRTRMLVNDLDLVVTRGLVPYRPWVLDVNNPGAAATKGDNIVDNVEQVVVTTPSSGLYTVHVSHKGSLTGPGGAASQTFALVISGHSLTEPPVMLVNGGNFSAEVYHGHQGQPGHLKVKNTGGSLLSWTATSPSAWLVPSPASGTGTGEEDVVVLGLNTAGLAPGFYSTTVSVVSTGGDGPLLQTRIVNVTVHPSLPPGTAVDSVPGGIALSGSGSDWLGQAVNAINGDAARSGAVTTGQDSIIAFTAVPAGKFTISRMLSGAADDLLETRVDNVLKSTVSGNTAWTDTTLTITGAGTHEVSFVHRKGSTPPSQTDGAWLDDLRFHAAPVVANPGKLYALQGQAFSYNIQATGNATSYSVDGLAAVTGLSVNSGTGLISGTPSVNGTFSLTLRATNSAASGTQVVLLRVLPQPWVDAGADYPQTDATISDPQPWYTQTVVKHDGVDAIQSGANGHNTDTAAWMTVNGPGVASFWWRVSSEPTWDKLIVQLDGAEQASIHGESGWLQRTITIPEGEHEIRFIYHKDFSISAGSDAGWVDQFTLVRKPEFLGPDVAGALVGQSFLYVVEGLYSPTSYGVAPLPAGLALNASTGRITGTPTVQAITQATATITNAAGSTSRMITFNVGRFITIPDAADTRDITWETSGAGAWYGQAGISHDGVDAVRSPVLGEGAEGVLRFPTPQPGRVFFRYRTSIQDGPTPLTRDNFAVAGNIGIAGGTFEASGDSGPVFNEASVRVSGGGYATFSYRKNSDGITAGQDAVWLDQVRYYVTPILQGVARSTFAGQYFSFNVTSTGGPFDSFSTTSLPPGLGLNQQARTISGTPSADGTTIIGMTLTGPGGTSIHDAGLTLTVHPSVPIAAGLDWTPLLVYPMTTGGDAPWFGQTLDKADGVDAGRSGLIGPDGRTWVQTTVPGNSLLKWKWKVSSESGYDFLRILVDGEEAASVSGEQDWAARSLALSAGDHTIRFLYSKDSSVDAGSDAAWVDELTYVFIPALTGPSSVTGTVGTSLSASPTGLSVFGSSWTAVGLPPGIAINPASGVMSGTPASAGVFQAAISASNEAGTGTRAVSFTIAQSSTPAAAADGSGLTWASERGQASWFGQSLVTHDGVDALQSGYISHATIAGDTLVPSRTTASASVTGPGVIAFWCRVDSELNYDFLTVQVDDHELLRLSGNVGWNRRVLEIQPGLHRVRFIYSKDASLSTDADAAWVDEVSFTPGPVPAPVRITGIRFSANGLDILVDFNSRTGRNYTIERSTDPAFWTPFAGTLNGNGSLMSFTHSNGRTGNPRWFYRVKEITP